MHSPCPLPAPCSMTLVCPLRVTFSHHCPVAFSIEGTWSSLAVHPERNTPDRLSRSHCLGFGAVERKLSPLERAHCLVGKPSLQPKMLRASGQESLSKQMPPPAHPMQASWEKRQRIKRKSPEEELEQCARLISWDKGCVPTACHTVLPVCVMSLPKTSPHSKGGYCCVSWSCPCISPPTHTWYRTVGLCISPGCATFSMSPRFPTILLHSRGLADQGVWP